MKICHITTTHSRTDSRIFKRQCKTLANNGHNVLYICCDGKPKEDRNGIEILSYTDNVMDKYSRYGLLFKPFQFAEFVFSKHADIYQIHDFELLEVGRLLAKKGCKVVFDSHENWYGMFSNHLPGCSFIIKYLLGCYYKFVLPKYAAVFSVSPNMVSDLSKYNGEAYLVSNFPQIKGLNINQNQLRSEHKTFIYQGTVYSISNQEEIIQAFQNTEYNYLIVGNIEDEYKAQLNKLDKGRKVKYIKWTSPEELSTIMQNCIAGIVILDYDPICCGKEGQLGSNKIFEYMLSGLPVICTDFSLWKDRIIEKYNCGLCVPPQNPEAVRYALDYLANNQDEAKAMGKRGQDAIINKFNWDISIDEYLEIYNRIYNK